MHRDIESKAAVDSFSESIKLASLRQLPIVDLIDCAARLTSVGQEQSSASPQEFMIEWGNIRCMAPIRFAGPRLS